MRYSTAHFQVFQHKQFLLISFGLNSFQLEIFFFSFYKLQMVLNLRLCFRVVTKLATVPGAVQDEITKKRYKTVFQQTKYFF